MKQSAYLFFTSHSCLLLLFYYCCFFQYSSTNPYSTMPAMTVARTTIFALASASGRAGVAVIRVSGREAPVSLARLTAGPLPPARQAVTRGLRHPGSNALLDHALVLRFAGPASFTGEDVVEYHLHGGRAVVDGVLDALRTEPGHPPGRTR